MKRRQAWLDGQFDLIPSDWSLSMRLGRPPTWRAAMAAVREASGSGSARRMAHWKTPTSTEKGVPARASAWKDFWQAALAAECFANEIDCHGRAWNVVEAALTSEQFNSA